MTTFRTYPKIKSVRPESGKTLLVEFENGQWRLYDCKPLLRSEAFGPLQEEAIFRCAHADPHGYAVIWDDGMDLAESEVWLNGRNAEPRARADGEDAAAQP